MKEHRFHVLSATDSLTALLSITIEFIENYDFRNDVNLVYKSSSLNVNVLI